jgi:hypothetical protein
MMALVRHGCTLALIFAAAFSAPPADADGRPTGPLAPASGALLGAYVDTHRDVGIPSFQNDLIAFETDMGRPLDIDHRYFGFSNPFSKKWPLAWDVAAGRIPLISWARTPSTTILSGSDDAIIRAHADEIAALGTPVFLEWAWEMDIHQGITGTPADFIAAWQHVHDLFVEQGATNAVWVWCPTALGFAKGKAQTYYPGSDYVDWVCSDGYNWGNVKPKTPWRTFSTVFKAFYAWGVTTGKPLMIGEYGCGERAAGEKAAWLLDARTKLETIYPSVEAVLYFDSEDWAQGYDWRLNSSADAYAAFHDMANDPYFNQRATPPPG